MLPVDIFRIGNHTSRLSRRRSSSRSGTAPDASARKNRGDSPAQRGSRYPEWDAYYASEHSDELL